MRVTPRSFPFEEYVPENDQFALQWFVENAAKEFGVTVSDIYSDRRGGGLPPARWAVMWAARKGTHYSLPRIGLALNRDHTTVMHGLSRAAELMASDESYREKCNAVLRGRA